MDAPEERPEESTVPRNRDRLRTDGAGRGNDRRGRVLRSRSRTNSASLLSAVVDVAAASDRHVEGDRGTDPLHTRRCLRPPNPVRSSSRRRTSASSGRAGEGPASSGWPGHDHGRNTGVAGRWRLHWPGGVYRTWAWAAASISSGVSSTVVSIVTAPAALTVKATAAAAALSGRSTMAKA